MGNRSTIRKAFRGTKGRMASSFITLLLLFSFVLGQAGTLVASAAPLAGGDIDLDLIAAGPGTYNHTTGIGGAYKNRTISKNTGVVESLEGGDFACGDLVVFFTAIDVRSNPDAEEGSVDLTYTFDGDTTSGSLVGYDDLVSVAIDPSDTGNVSLDGGSGGGVVEAASIVSEEKFGFGDATKGNDKVVATIRVDGVDGGEQVILRFVLHLYCDFTETSITGNIHVTLDDALVVGGQRIQTGEQTVPLKQAGNILVPGLNVLKSCPATATVGETITYTITVENTGSDVLTNLVVSDPLLGGVLAGFPTDLLAGASASADFEYVVGPTPDPLPNTVTATATAEQSQFTLTDTADCEVDVLYPLLDIDKIANPAGPVSAGEPIGFDITVTNEGPGKAFDVELTDDLPGNPGLSWTVGTVTGGWTCGIVAGILTCDGGIDPFDLGVDESASVHISSSTTRVSCAVISNTAIADASNTTPVQDIATVTVQCPSLRIVKEADASRVSAGDEIGYTITVTNDGPGTAFGVVMTDTLPTNAGLSWRVEGTPVGWTCNPITAGVLTCGGPNFNLGDDASASVHIVSPTTSATCGEVRNEASVSATHNLEVDSGIVTIIVECASLVIMKTADASTVDAGARIGYTITVTNNAAGTAKGVVLHDTLPTNAGLSWTVDGGTGAATCLPIAASQLTCNFGDMASTGPTSSYTVHISSPTTAATCGVVRNFASATSTNDGNPSVGPVDITVICPPLGIDIVKGGPSLAHVGDTIKYTFDVRLTTPETLYNVVVTDPNCNEGAPVYVSGDDGDAALEAGEVWIYTCSHLVTAADPDPLPNTATVVGHSDDGRQVTDKDDHVVDLIHPDIRIIKTVSPDSGEPGDEVTYKYKVTNTGDTTLYGVTIDDDVLGHIGDIAVLNAGETVTLTKDWTLPEDEVLVVNVAIAEGEDVLGAQVSDDDDAVVTIVLAENPPEPPGPTAFTGSDATRYAMIAAALLGLGLMALAASRRRRRA